jgi:hypothetical protein
MAKQQCHHPGEALVAEAEQRRSPMDRRAALGAGAEVDHLDPADIRLGAHVAEVADLAHDVPDPLERALDRAQGVAPGVGGALRVGQEKLDVGEGRHERVVDLVVEGHRHLADRPEALGAHQVALGGHQGLAELPGPPDPLQHLGEQLTQRAILGEVIVRAAAERRRGQRLVAVRGHHHDRGRVGPGADGVEHVEAAGVGELMVEQDHVGLGERLQGFPRAAHRGDRGVPIGLQDPPGQSDHAGIVVDHQHPHGLRAVSHVPGSPLSRERRRGRPAPAAG